MSRFPSFYVLLPAATYSPTPLPVQYHRPRRGLLPCSKWERVWPLRHSHREFYDVEGQGGFGTNP